jgi:hydroxybutyrate-dimer hydrolase
MEFRRPRYPAADVVRHRQRHCAHTGHQHARHFDAFLDLPGFAENYVPLHVYFVQALDMVYAALRHGTPLPESQVVRARPRGKDGLLVRPLMPRNLPPIVLTPLPADQIRFTGQRLTIPD